MSDLVILNHRASRVVLQDLICLPAEVKNDEASGGKVVTPSRTACTQAQADAIKAHRPSARMFEHKILSWGKAPRAEEIPAPAPSQGNQGNQKK